MLRVHTRLLVQPGGPLVGDGLVLEAVARGHGRQEALHLRAHVVLDEPELHARPAQAAGRSTFSSTIPLSRPQQV